MIDLRYCHHCIKCPSRLCQHRCSFSPSTCLKLLVTIKWIVNISTTPMTYLWSVYYLKLFRGVYLHRTPCSKLFIPIYCICWYVSACAYEKNMFGILCWAQHLYYCIRHHIELSSSHAHCSIVIQVAVIDVILPFLLWCLFGLGSYGCSNQMCSVCYEDRTRLQHIWYNFNRPSIAKDIISSRDTNYLTENS